MYCLKKQTIIYYLFNFINRFMVYMPVFVVFLLEKGLTQSQVMTLMAAYNLAILAGEIPTGVVADKFSRKISVIAGCLIQGISMLCMIYASSFVTFLAIEVLFGVGMTFQSGAMSAMFYDYLQSIDREDLYPKIEGKRWGCVFLSQAFASVLGGIIASYNISATVTITSVAYIFSALILIGFNELKNDSFDDNVSGRIYIKHTIITFREILKKQEILEILLIIVFAGTLFSTTMWLYQPYYKSLGINVEIYGIIYFAMNSVSALGGFLSSKLNCSEQLIKALYISSNLLLVGLMGLIHTPLGVVIPSVVFFANGLFNPWIQGLWEKNISTSIRSTASSALSLISSLAFAVFSIPLGAISDALGVNVAFLTAACCFLLLAIAYLCLKKKR